MRLVTPLTVLGATCSPLPLHGRHAACPVPLQIEHFGTVVIFDAIGANYEGFGPRDRKTGVRVEKRNRQRGRHERPLDTTRLATFTAAASRRR